MKENPNTLGKYLRTERLKREMTLVEAAELAKISPSQLSAIERGVTYCPTPRMCERLSLFCGISPIEVAKKIDFKSHQLYYYIERSEEEKNG